MLIHSKTIFTHSVGLLLVASCLGGCGGTGAVGEHEDVAAAEATLESPDWVSCPACNSIQAVLGSSPGDYEVCRLRLSDSGAVEPDFSKPGYYHPGKVYQGGCWSTYGSSHVIAPKTSPAVQLLNKNGKFTYAWQDMPDGTTAPLGNAVQSDAEPQHSSSPLYVCESHSADWRDNALWHPGKYAYNNRCYFAWGSSLLYHQAPPTSTTPIRMLVVTGQR